MTLSVLKFKTNILLRLCMSTALILFFMLIFGGILLLDTGINILAEPYPSQNINILETKYENDFGFVSYPVVFGNSNEQLDQEINEKIINEGKIEQRLASLNALSEYGWGLEMDYDYFLQGDILSIVLNARGDLGENQFSQAYIPLVYDLVNTETINIAQIFTDLEGAYIEMEDMVINQIYPSMSGYMTNDEISPIPKDSFSLNEWGLQIYYEADKLSYLSGYSGALHFLFSELEDFLNLEEGGVPSRIGAIDRLRPSSDGVDHIYESVNKGHLPWLPINIGDTLPSAIDRFRLLSDPDDFPGGRFIHLEDPLFRDVWLITDDLHEDYDKSIIQGIRINRGNLYWLILGKTPISTWRELLGEPAYSIELDDELAYAYWLEPGTSDYYNFDAYTLRLHGNKDEILSCLIIQQ